MSLPNADFSENALVERPAVALFAELGYSVANCFAEKFGPANATLGRETPADVVLVPKLTAALRKLNPGAADDAVRLAVEELTKDRGAMSLAHANREIYQLLMDGVRVSYTDDGAEANETLDVIDWNMPDNNDFFLASQFWVAGGVYSKRPDLIGFVNGLPLIFIELKKAHGKVEDAYKNNLRDYKSTIPQLFWYNAVVILSNGGQAKIGSVTAGWEHFSDWKRINSEGEQGVISLETLIRGVCEKPRFLDLVENFTLFDDGKGGLVKIVAKNHQYLGVNNAMAGLKRIKNKQGRLGVFWHTQGSGKSFSMVFFAQKVLRKAPGNWTFLVVTDRDELDNQIYKTFRNTGAATEECQADSGAHLKKLLKEDHRYIFTLIQKFVTKKGEQYPQLSDRSDVIVMTDEAHRSQYDVLALNMRNALPNAAFIGFTGTPLMAGEERTKEIFGDYVSVYNFRQSIEDGATVPLFYENRIPELQLANEHFKEDLDELIEEANLDDDQQRKLDREFAVMKHLITREDRLEKVAEDLVAHFMGRPQGGKGMVICIDKLTAVKMYEKVRRHWAAYLADLKAELPLANELSKPALAARIAYMETTDMAVVVSQEQNEVETFKEKGFDITPHRKRMVAEDLETKFKNADDPFRLVFVCAMWMTGFDAPCVSTIYLDKPMKNHTLMQTIARANRVFGEKNNGLIVDYVGVFRDLQRALAIYGSSSGGGVGPGECPIRKKEELVAELREAIADARAFCTERGVDLQTVLDAEGFQKIAFLDAAAKHLVDKQVKEAVADAVEKVIVNDDLKKKYLALAARVARLFKAILPDAAANEFAPMTTCLGVLAAKIRSFTEQASIEDLMEQVRQLLDLSVAAEGYRIGEAPEVIDLSAIDFDALKHHFDKARHKRTEAENLRAALGAKLERMVQLNKMRADLLEKFKKLIEEYNKGMNVNGFFEKLLAFAQELTQEEQRGVAEQLSEEELTIFDLLTKPTPDLPPKEKKEVKKIARSLLQTLKQAKLVFDWRKRLSTRAGVFTTVKKVLNDLPRIYTPELYQEKCDVVYRHISEAYGEGRSVYESA